MIILSAMLWEGGSGKETELLRLSWLPDTFRIWRTTGRPVSN